MPKTPERYNGNESFFGRVHRVARFAKFREYRGFADIRERRVNIS